MGARSRIREIDQKVRGRLALGMRDEAERYCLRRDLDVPHQHPTAKIEITVRRLREDDVETLYGGENSATDQQELRWRRAYVEQQPHHGWVAADAEDRACYVQWLLPASENDFITRAGDFQPLRPGEALLEHAFTPAAARGKGVMSAAMSRIAEHGRDVGARFVVTYVGTDNIASLKGCQRAGFAPDLVHRRTRRLFGLRDVSHFEPLDALDPRRTAFIP